MQKTHNEYRQALIEGTIKTVAENGIENVTTRSVCKEAGLSEVYIYRYFLDKNDLLRRAFIYDDKGLAVMVEKEFNETDFSNVDYKEKIASLLSIIWNSFMNYKNKALFFYYYYYSSQMVHSVDTHYEIWGSFLDSISKLFPGVKNVHRVTDVVLETIMNYAAKVHFGLEENTLEVRNSIYEICVPLIIKVFGLDEESN